MLKIAQYKCPHCELEIELDIMVSPPKWDELYAEQTCTECGKTFDGKANKIMTRTAPEVTFRGGRQKGKQNSQANW